MANYVVKARLRLGTPILSHSTKRPCGAANSFAPTDEVFLFAAEHHGGRGLYARGVVIEATRGVGSRVSVAVKRMGAPCRLLGRAKLRPIRDRPNGGPATEIDHKLHRQATNKVAGISEAAAAYLNGFFCNGPGHVLALHASG